MGGRGEGGNIKLYYYDNVFTRFGADMDKESLMSQVRAYLRLRLGPA